MEYTKFIWILSKLRTEKVLRRAKGLCNQLMDEARKRNIPLKHILEVNRQLLDNGIVNKDELDQFKIIAISFWNKREIGLNDDIKISNYNDIQIEKQ